MHLLGKLQNLEKIIGVFITKMEEKKNKIKNDEFYNVKSPLQVPTAFSKQHKQKTLQVSPQLQHSTQFPHFYISEKFYNNLAYKKLFAPKTLIHHRSSMIEVGIDYQVENSFNRKTLRITVSVTNSGSSNLLNVTMEVSEKRNRLIAVNPSKVQLKELRANEIIHQFYFFSGFEQSEYFVPVEIAYETSSGVQKSMHVPISIDVSKFIVKEKPSTYKNEYKFKTMREFTLNNKSDLTFYWQGERKIVRYQFLNDMERFELEETLSEPGYNMKISSTFAPTESKVDSVIEYLKFMYD